MKAIYVFLAVAAVLAGTVLLLSVPYNGFFWDHAAEAFVGVLLLAGGVTYFWKLSGFRGISSK